MDNKPKVVAVIPARYRSTRFEGKPIAKLCDKPLIYWVYIQAKKAKNIDDVFVATDDERIKKEVEKFGGKVVMTSDNNPTGSDRVAEATKQLDADIVVDVQGDEPLVKPEMIEQAVEPLLDDGNLQLTTLMTKIDNPGDFIDSTVVKAVVDKFDNVLFLSRSPIPYPKSRQNFVIFKQIGLYAYRKDFLQEFKKMGRTPLESVEDVELLRAIESGYKVRGVETTYKMYSVDTLSDLIEVEKIIKMKLKTGEL